MVIGGHGDTTMIPLTRFATYKGMPVANFISAEKLEEVAAATMVGGATLTKLLGTSAWYAPGAAGDNTTEMHAILAEFGLPYVYPKAVETAADKIPAEITPEEIARREDFRKVTTFTIDPKDAKDFDDALSIRPIKDGLWEVGVHIADVTHYVKEGGIIGMVRSTR